MWAYAAAISGGRPNRMVSRSQNKTEEDQIKVRPCSLLLLGFGNPFHHSELGKVLISQLLKKLADKNHHAFLWTSWGPCRSSLVIARPSLTHQLRIAAYPWHWYVHTMQYFLQVFDRKCQWNTFALSNGLTIG